MKINRGRGRRQRPSLQHRDSFSTPSNHESNTLCNRRGSSVYQGKPKLGPLIPCPHCPELLLDDFCLKSHISRFHGHLMHYTCSLCGKGYQTSMGLRYHMQAHQGQIFACPICDCKLTRKFSLKMHLRNVHNSSKCSSCSGIFTLGVDYESHVLNCGFN